MVDGSGTDAEGGFRHSQPSVEQARVTALWREAASALEASPDELMGPGWRSGFWDRDKEPACAECGRLREQLDAARQEVDRYRRAVVAHHDIGTLSDEVLHEYDFQSCPVCARAALGVVGEQE